MDRIARGLNMWSLSLRFGSLCLPFPFPSPKLRNLHCLAHPLRSYAPALSSSSPLNFPLSSSSSSSPAPHEFALSTGLEDALLSYIFSKKRATEVVHFVWKHHVLKGDTVIDATCGNGYDTIAMVKMVNDDSHLGRVYAMDIQQEALDNTSALLEELLNQKEKELVKLFPVCHSRMEDVVPESCPVRLIAFNLGYLPGGNKAIITQPGTTLEALEAAKRILSPGGLISIVVYVGHSGGLDEMETIQKFSGGLAADEWVCCKLEMLNRPLAPVPIFLFKR